MSIRTLRNTNSYPLTTLRSFSRRGNVDHARGWANLVAIREQGLSWDLLANLCGQLSKHLPRLSHADMAAQ